MFPVNPPANMRSSLLSFRGSEQTGHYTYCKRCDLETGIPRKELVFQGLCVSTRQDRTGAILNSGAFGNSQT